MVLVYTVIGLHCYGSCVHELTAYSSAGNSRPQHTVRTLLDGLPLVGHVVSGTGPLLSVLDVVAVLGVSAGICTSPCNRYCRPASYQRTEAFSPTSYLDPKEMNEFMGKCDSYREEVTLVVAG